MLSPEHLAELFASGISPEFADRRGYESITEPDPKRLAELGFVKDILNKTGLLIPLRGYDGSVWGYQFKPDIPRIRPTGQVLKYELPPVSKQRPGIDFPPGVKDLIDNPDIPLAITEGIKKCDAAAERGMCVVGLIGVWNWVGTGTYGGKGTALSDWRDIPLKSDAGPRRVRIAFDSDVSRKEGVQKAAHELANYLAAIKGAKVEYLWLPDDCEKVGLDDFFVRGGTVEQLNSLVHPTQPPMKPKLASVIQFPTQPAEPEPPAEPIDGAELLDETHDTLTSYVVFGNKHQSVATTLWTVATHGLQAWQHATRLIIGSPQKRCGKSRLMDIIDGLSFKAMACADTSTAAIFRTIGDLDEFSPTLLMDEADAMWSSRRQAEQNEDLRAIFNAGWQRNRPTIRCVGPNQIPTPFNTFAMVAFATKGVRLPDTITDRAISIDLERRAANEKVARFRIRRDQPRLHLLRSKINAWVRDPDRLKMLTEVEPDMPEGIEDRAQDAWEPLIAIADAAGGDWPQLARDACEHLTESVEDDDADIQLLIDIRRVFATAQSEPGSVTGGKFLPTMALVKELRDIEEAPWGDTHSDDYMTAHKLAAKLKPFGVRPKHNALKTVRGYWLTSFTKPFSRYLPSNRPTVRSTAADQGKEGVTPEPSATVRDRPDRPTPDTLDTSGHFSDFGKNGSKPQVDEMSPDTSDTLDGHPARNGARGTPERLSQRAEENVRRGYES